MTLKRKVSAAFRARNLFPKLTGYNLQNSTCISMANQMYISIWSYPHSVDGLTFVPARICPQPISRQCFSTLRLKAIFSPTEVQTGVVRPILAKSAFTAITRPPVDKEPMFTIKTSFLLNLDTLAAFLSPSILTPKSRRSK